MKKRRVFGAVLMVMALIVMLLPAAEADAETSASAFTIQRGELLKYTGSESTVSVPKEVTVIGEGAFQNNTSVEKVILPDSVEQIKAYAFWGCDNLKSVTLGKGLTAVGDFSFTNCGGLQTMTIPNTVRSIGIQAFASCTKLEDITIPAEVTSIKDDAFDGDYLLNIHCETGSYADKYAQAFYERQKEMPVYGDVGVSGGADPGVPADGVYSGSWYQQPDSGNQDGDLPQGQVFGSSKVVGNQAVILMQNAGLPVQGNSGASGSQDNTQGGTASVLPDAGELPWRIPERAHYRDAAFTETVLDGEIREIGRFAYARSGLRSITLPDGLEQIEYAAFYHCDDLAEVVLPESVTSVAAKAFAHTPWVDDFLDGRDGTEGDFLVSGGVLMAYRGSGESVAVPDGVCVIAGEAFSGHGEIKKISFPTSVQYVDGEAFEGCMPEEIEYDGTSYSLLEFAIQDPMGLGSMEDVLAEEQVALQAQSAAPTGDGFGGRERAAVPVAAAALFLGGCVCMFRRAV
ncbi:MAG: leucine-rich repeat domain-containing protein [Muribaculum sp.]|nr:leucine-rich repeat domain-containing protein [Muribaculum sp.]